MGRFCKDCKAYLTLRINTYCSICSYKRGEKFVFSERNVGRESEE